LQYYREYVYEELKRHGNFKNQFEVPKVQSVVVTCILGKLFKDNNLMAQAEKDIALITGQKPAYILAKKSVAGFNLRSGMKLGYKVTIRGARVFEFLDRMINIALSQKRNLNAFSSESFDGKGNFSMGFSDYTCFPEIGFRNQPLGCGVTITTSAKNDYIAQVLLEYFGLPFQKPTLPKNGQEYYIDQPKELFEYVDSLRNKPVQNVKNEENVNGDIKDQKKKQKKEKENV
jgi:large subunit ribosomal protein L5